MLADWLHLAAASVWVGGLTHFAAGMWSLRSRGAAAGEGVVPFTAVLVPRFSALALTRVATLALTGTYMAVLRLGSWEALAGTLYGRALLVKLTLAAPMLLLGAVNLLWVTPRLRLGARESMPTNVVDRFRQIVTSEVTLGAAVLLFSADGRWVIFSAVGEGPGGAGATPTALGWLDRLLGARVASAAPEAHNVPSDWWQVPVAGGAPTRLTKLYDTALFGAAGPDGRYLAFLSASGLYLLQPDGSGLTLLLKTSSTGTVHWLP